ASKRRFPRSVTALAILTIDGLTLRRELPIDVSGRHRRRFSVGPQPVSDAQEPIAIERRRRCAGTECRAQIALVDRAVVAIPVQVHALTGLLVPYRREVNDPEPLFLRHVLHREAEQRLGRLKRVDASWSPSGKVDELEP